ncbi:hypothetical protein EUZ85_19660 [Hahella sp. KA22]|uniref:hypothetical protein n=1 Tax=Hahella sp. KA22 TaxID=1628392 RepID=UPI000FDD989B|nr:hypothetical protein [Hahella sp. KA22]AZZ92822.1 hypothetical protein ENC22_17080 [Hahella sp. KA22]QAY56196.1 hypothetical protein EUZ85_19660 [Hahella sp. KA22]
MLQPDSYDYQQLHFDRRLFLSKAKNIQEQRQYLAFSLHNLPLEPFWEGSWVGEFRSDDDESHRPIPDISMWLPGTMILSPKAYKVLAELISTCGELLPVNCQGERFYIFNCMTIVNADEAGSRRTMEGGRIVSIDKLNFSPTSRAIFKTTYDNTWGLYCQEAVKDAIERSHLSGMQVSEELSRSFDQ